MRPVRHGFVLSIGIALAIAGGVLGQSGSLVPLKVGPGQEGYGRSPLRRGPIATHPARLVVVSGEGKLITCSDPASRPPGVLKTHWPLGIECRSTRRSRRKRPFSAVPWR